MAKTKIQKTADSKKITALKIFGGVLFIALLPDRPNGDRRLYPSRAGVGRKRSVVRDCRRNGRDADLLSRITAVHAPLSRLVVYVNRISVVSTVRYFKTVRH